VTNQSGALFEFTSATALGTPSNGQARIAAESSGGTFEI
jgi:hypothetical protein